MRFNRQQIKETWQNYAKLEHDTTKFDISFRLGHSSRVSEWLNLTDFLGTADNEVHLFHVSRVITAYTLESLSSLA